MELAADPAEFVQRRTEELAKRTQSGELLFACPACGFKTLEETCGYDICQICGWEDDPSALWNPEEVSGPNNETLVNWQRRVLEGLPPEVTEVKQIVRDPAWRPITEKDLHFAPEWRKQEREMPAKLKEDFPPQYWKWKK